MLAGAGLFSPTQVSIADGLPDLGEGAQAVFSPHAERRYGDAIIHEIRATESGYVDDPEISGYLNHLGGKLAANIEQGGQSFDFFALRDSTLNAFALPGGYIGVHTGLILAAQSESELGGVLAHEISHVTQHHLARNIVASGQGQLVSMVAMALAILAARNNPDVAMGAAVAGQAAGIQNQLNFSRDFEREADRTGLELLERSGYDIRGMATFFERMQKSGRVFDNNAPSYLRTHPLTTERIADMGNRIEGRPYKQVEDSLEFLLVRAKLRSDLGTGQEAVTDFTQRLAGGLSGSAESVARYGLARALLRARDYVNGERELAKLRQQKIASPMFETLAAEFRRRGKDAAGAAALLTTAHARYPQERAITYALIETKLELRDNEGALRVATENLLSYPSDPELHALQAKTYAQMGRRLAQHRAQAEAYVLNRQVTAAIEQLTLAQKEGDGNFYEQSQVDARIRELKFQLCDELRLLNGGNSAFRQRRPMPEYCRYFDYESEPKS